MKDWEAMEETDMIFEKIYNRALARLQKRVKGQAPCRGVGGAERPGDARFAPTEAERRLASPRSFALKTKKGRGKLPAPDYQG